VKFGAKIRDFSDLEIGDGESFGASMLKGSL
jgi:hypothetical protein